MHQRADMFTLSETAPLLPVINKKTAEINDFNGLSGAYGTWTHGLLNAIQARSQLRYTPEVIRIISLPDTSCQ